MKLLKSIEDLPSKLTLGDSSECLEGDPKGSRSALLVAKRGSQIIMGKLPFSAIPRTSGEDVDLGVRRSALRVRRLGVLALRRRHVSDPWRSGLRPNILISVALVAGLSLSFWLRSLRLGYVPADISSSAFLCTLASFLSVSRRSTFRLT